MQTKKKIKNQQKEIDKTKREKLFRETASKQSKLYRVI